MQRIERQFVGQLFFEPVFVGHCHRQRGRDRGPERVRSRLYRYGRLSLVPPPGSVVRDPDYTLAEDGTYSLSLAKGTWDVAAFYEVNPLGGVFLGMFETITVHSGGSVNENLTVAYQKPSTSRGRCG